MKKHVDTSTTNEPNPAQALGYFRYLIPVGLQCCRLSPRVSRWLPRSVTCPKPFGFSLNWWLYYIHLGNSWKMPQPHQHLKLSKSCNGKSASNKKRNRWVRPPATLGLYTVFLILQSPVFSSDFSCTNQSENTQPYHHLLSYTQFLPCCISLKQQTTVKAIPFGAIWGSRQAWTTVCSNRAKEKLLLSYHLVHVGDADLVTPGHFARQTAQSVVQLHHRRSTSAILNHVTAHVTAEQQHESCNREARWGWWGLHGPNADRGNADFAPIDCP